MPKAFVTIAGRPLLAYAVERVAGLAHLSGVVVVAPRTHLDAARAALTDIDAPVQVVAGGAQRSDSVRLGLEQLDRGCDVILVHDAARAFTPTAVFERVVDAVRAGAPGAVPGLPVVDTVKTVDADGVITGTPDRAALRAVQTPQGFDARVLRAAYANAVTAASPTTGSSTTASSNATTASINATSASSDVTTSAGAGASATDDAALVEATGHAVRVVEGDPLAFKVTTPADLDHASRLVAGRDGIAP